MSIVTIPNNHVYVRPLDPEIKLLFEPYLNQCPFRCVRPEDLQCSVLYATHTVPERLLYPEKVYTAVITGAQVWWDSYLGVKDIVITLESSDLVTRHNDLIQQSGALNVYDAYVPHITLAYDIPNTNPRYRWWFNDVFERFATRYKGTVIRFSGESVEDSAGNLPPRGNEQMPVKPVL